VSAVREQAQNAMQAAVAELLEPDPDTPGKRRIRPGLRPDPGFVDVGLRGDASELNNVRVLDPVSYSGDRETKKFVDAVSGVMERRITEDQRIVMMEGYPPP
jgi:2-oxoisovalerate dehydrogenase E1 component